MRHECARGCGASDAFHHAPAKAALDRIRAGTDIGHACTHALAETFSVLSRMPTKPKLSTEDVVEMLERNIVPYFVLLVLQSDEYLSTMRDFAAKGFGGGRIYDALHLRAAASVALDRIYTFNDREWKQLSPEMAPLIYAP